MRSCINKSSFILLYYKKNLRQCAKIQICVGLLSLLLFAKKHKMSILRVVCLVSYNIFQGQHYKRHGMYEAVYNSGTPTSIYHFICPFVSPFVFVTIKMVPPPTPTESLTIEPHKNIQKK